MDSIILNEKQKIAVIHNEGPMIVIAGPGSGKTTVIVYRIKYIIKKYNVNPSNIIVITFTKAAAEEMKDRFNGVMNTINSNNVTFGTFHSYFFRIIRIHYEYKLSDVLREEEKRNVLQEIVINLKINFYDEEEFLQNIINEISFVKNELIDINYYSSMNCSTENFIDIYNKYEKYKYENNKIDFDDMLLKCYYLLKSNDLVLKQWQEKYKYMLIDEFQDINKVQYECIKLLVPKNGNLFIVGDDDQSIYKFRGASPEFLLRFPKDYEDVKIIILDINYRSTNQIIKLCNVVIKNNKNRYDKVISGTDKKGKTPILMYSDDIGSEAIEIAKKINKFQNKIDLNKIAVIYRTNIQSRAIVDAFMDYNIPYKIKDEIPSIYEHWIAKDIYSYLSIAINRGDNNSFERIINKPKRYINRAYINLAKENMESEDFLIDIIYSVKELKKWQVLRIEELSAQLNNIKKKNTYNAFKYIRKIIGYDNYINEYAQYRKMSSKGLFEIVDELQESSKGYEKIDEYLSHIREVLFELKEQKQAEIRKEELNGVTLTTMHSSKGLEFDVVFITSAVEGVIPYVKSRSEDEIEEERRLFYVGMTRAKKLLFISIVKTRHEKSVKPTRFLNNIIKIGEKK